MGYYQLKSTPLTMESITVPQIYTEVWISNQYNVSTFAILCQSQIYIMDVHEKVHSQRKSFAYIAVILCTLLEMPTLLFLPTNFLIFLHVKSILQKGSQGPLKLQNPRILVWRLCPRNLYWGVVPTRASGQPQLLGTWSRSSPANPLKFQCWHL